MNKVCLIFGASSGIGLAAARRLLGEGYAVYNASRRPCPESAVESFKTDVTDKEAVRRAVLSAAESGGRLDLVIYSAGYSMACPLELADEADFRYLFDVNLFGAITALKAAVPVMKTQGYGRFVAVSSLASTIPIAFDPYYCASKAALEVFLMSAQLELYKYNILLSAVRPGGTATEFSYKRKICAGGGDMLAAAQRLLDIEQGGMSADAVAKTIARVCRSRRPPLSAAAGAGNKALSAAARLLPKKTLLRIAKSVYLSDT